MVRTHRGSRSEDRKRAEDTVHTLIVHNELLLTTRCRGYSHGNDVVEYARW